MYKILIGEILKPLIRRAGSVMGGSLIGLGLAQEQALQLETASISLLLVLADLILSNLERRAENE
jgi:hypothetical protein